MNADWSRAAGGHEPRAAGTTHVAGVRRLVGARALRAKGAVPLRPKQKHAARAFATIETHPFLAIVSLRLILCSTRRSPTRSCCRPSARATPLTAPAPVTITSPRQSVALLTADRGELLQLSLEHATISPLSLEGYAFGEAARLWEVFLLDGDRVVIRESTSKTLVLAKRTRTGLAHLADVPFAGAFAVVGKRFLVGGAKIATTSSTSSSTPRRTR